MTKGNHRIVNYREYGCTQGVVLLGHRVEGEALRLL